MTVMVADWANFSQALPVAVQFGVGLEFQEFTSPDHLAEPEEWIKTILDGAKNLPLLSMHGPFAEMIPASQDPWVRQVASRRFQQAYDIAHKTAARHLILHSGYIPKTYRRESWVQNTCNFWIDFLQDKHKPGLIHLENVYEDDFSTLQELVDNVNQAMGDELLTICLDIGHVNANSSHNLEEWISGLGVRIKYVHLHNNGGVLDDHWRLDKGTIDIPKVVDLLQIHAPDALWTVETTVEDIEPSLLWLQEKGYLDA
ncbi:MAG TPA: TIM barrel protein [Anaerolineales bacterium]|nr:TIM barrel protein [Anaerolineales bacterium]